MPVSSPPPTGIHSEQVRLAEDVRIGIELREGYTGLMPSVAWASAQDFGFVSPSRAKNKNQTSFVNLMIGRFEQWLQDLGCQMLLKGVEAWTCLYTVFRKCPGLNMS